MWAAPVTTAQSPTQDTVTGNGHVFEAIPGSDIPFHVFGFNFSAASGPAGENPTGQVNPLSSGERLGFMTFEGNVTCLAVSGNRAAVGALGTYFGFPAAVVMTVVDGGPPDSGADTFNAVIVTESQTPPPSPNCATASFSNQLVVSTGDLAVRDAQPLPTSKDQCKNDGWRQYGFKNQGACIAFVIRKAVQACVFEQVAIGRPAFRSKYGGGRFDLFAFLSCVRQRVEG